MPDANYDEKKLREFVEKGKQNLTDNWASRGERMICGSCMYYVPKGDSRKGRCRRHAPTMKGWPVVFPDDWCGDHKLK